MKPTVLVVSHDAGGANQLLYWCLAMRNRLDFLCHLKGPALKIFRESPMADRIVEQWVDTDFVLTGTGWQTDFERQAIAEAKVKGKPVASYLDYWANYRERFLEPNGELILPDEIWVPDTVAREVAYRELGGSLRKVRVVLNQYWRQLKKNIKTYPEPTSPCLLIALEPIRISGISESILYQHLAEALPSHFPYTCKIVVRPHPSGEGKGAVRLVECLSLIYKSVTVSNGSLASDMAAATDVMGFQSSTLPLALDCKKRAWSYFPLKEYPLFLPHEGISYINA